MTVFKPSFLAGIFSAALSFASVANAETNTKCPIMVDDDADTSEVAEFEGQKVYLCCGKCAKLWEKNPKYYIKASLDLLPQFKGQEQKLGLDKVELLPQKFCPIKKKSVVSPDSPSTEYKGVKVYFFDKAAQKKWEADPEGSAKKAIAAGILPQLAGK